MARRKITAPTRAIKAAVNDAVRPTEALLTEDGWERADPDDRDGFVKDLGDGEFLFYSVRSCVVSLRSPESSLGGPLTVVGFGKFGRRATLRSLRAFLAAVAACDK